MSKNSNVSNTNDEIKLTDLVLLLRSWLLLLKTKIFWLLGFLVLGVLIGAAISFFSPRKYAAKVTFVLDEQGKTNPLGNLAGGLSAFGVNTSVDADLFSGDNLIWLYTSKRMLEETLMTSVESTKGKCNLLTWLLKIDKDLIEVEEKMKKNDAGYQPVTCGLTFDNLNTKQRKLLAAAASTIRSVYLNVRMEENTTGIVAVVFNSKDEAFSLHFTRELVNKVNAFYIDTKTRKNKAQVALLQAKVDEVNREMGGSMYAAAAAADKVPYANPNQQHLHVSAQRKVVDVQASSAVYAAVVQQLEAAKIILEKETPLIQIVDNPQLPLPASKPSLPLFSIGFGVLFLALGVVFFLFRQLYSEVLHKTGEERS